MAQETSRILSDGNVQAIDTSLNNKLKDTTGQGIRAALVAYFTAVKNAIIGRLKLQDVATIESASTASKAYATGDFLAKDGNLYKATDDIAQGGTLNVGTNIEAAKVGDEISQLNSAIVKRKTVTLSLTGGGQSGSVSALFGIPNSSKVISLYIERDGLSLVRSYTLNMYGYEGYTLTIYENGQETTATSATVTVFYIQQ